MIVHTTLYIGLSGVGYVERHGLHKVTCSAAEAECVHGCAQIGCEYH